MYPYIVCFCGRSLGDIYDLFKALRLLEYKKYFASNEFIDPTMVQYSEDIKIECKEIFKILGVELTCCKTRLMTQVEFKSIY